MHISGHANDKGEEIRCQQRMQGMQNMHRAVSGIQENREAGQVQVVRAVRGERAAERKVRDVPRTVREVLTQAVPRRCGERETDRGVQPVREEAAAARVVPADRGVSAAALI